MFPAPLWLALVRAMLVVDDGTRITQLSLHGGRQRNENTAFLDTTPSPRGKAKRRRLRRKKGSQPRLAALGSPFQRKGLAWILPPSYGRRCPEGAEVGWGKRYERERRRSSQVDDIRERPIHRCAVPLPQWGRQRNENTAFLALSEQIHAYVGKQYRRTKPSPRETERGIHFSFTNFHLSMI